jgi:hypothetical protein
MTSKILLDKLYLGTMQKAIENVNLLPTETGDLDNAEHAYAMVGGEIMATGLVICKPTMDSLTEGFHFLGNDIAYLVSEHGDNGLVRTEPRWLGYTDVDKAGIHFFPSPGLAKTGLIKGLSDNDMLFLLATYRNGKALYHSDKNQTGTTLKQMYAVVNCQMP